VLVETLDPFLSGCENLYKNLPQPSSDIFAINCLLSAKAALQPYAFMGDRVAEMNDTISEHAASLISYQHSYFVHTSGLDTLVSALSSITDTAESLKIIPELEAFKPDALISASQQLDEFLPSALIDAAENLKKLRSRAMIQEITEEAASRFCEDFELVESKIIAADDLLYNEDEEDEDEPEPGLRDLFPRTSGEIRVLLS
jgi:hypothetical protein